MTLLTRPHIGDKVGAIANIAEDGAVNFFGWGHYMGDEMPPPGIIVLLPGVEELDPPPPNKLTKLFGGINAIAFSKGLELRRLRRKVPRISLFDGTTVWGCECWWGKASDIEKALEGRQINRVHPDQFRGCQPSVRPTEEIAGDLRVFLEHLKNYREVASNHIVETDEQRKTRQDFKPLRTRRKTKRNVKRVRSMSGKRPDPPTVEALMEDLRTLGFEAPKRKQRAIKKRLKNPRKRRAWKKKSLNPGGDGILRPWVW